MPNPKHWSTWVSQVTGKPIEVPVATSVDEIAKRRSGTGSLLEAVALSAPLPELAEVHEGVLLRERAGFNLTAEVYVPKGRGPFPTFLYLHGGGWTSGSARAVRRPAMCVAEQGFVVVNLEYGLAPEHPFPWAVEDCVYAARWAVHNAGRYSGKTDGLCIGGESAGANLSAATIVALTENGYQLDEGDVAGVSVSFRGAVLFYGVFDFPLTLQEPGSNAGSVEVRWNQAYLGPHFLKVHRNPIVSPIYAPNLPKFPPTYLSCGDLDALLGQSLVMTKALTQANVPTTLSVVAGLDHAFTYVEHLVPAARAEMQRVYAWLKERAAS